jgi:RNA polymerase sigma factor (sigma-70 family)
VQPHEDPARWDELIAGVAPESVLVVIDRAMGAGVRAYCSAEDVWQETLAAAWRDRAQHRWEGPGPYRAWLLAIARNRIRDVARALSADKRGAGERPVLFSGMNLPEGASLSSVLPAGSVTPSRVAGHREQAAVLAKALDGLDDEFRDVVRLHLFEGRAMPDVARELSLEVHVARYRFRKGAAALAHAVRALRSSSAGR